MEQNIEQQVTRGGITPTTYPTGLPKSFPFATEIISLPSEGLCYPENHPLSKGSIEIKLLTAKEEDILTSINLIRRNEHINKMLESIVVEPGVSINDILVGDKNAILVASRMLAFGAEYDVTVDDPETGEPTHVKVDLSQIQTKQLNKEILNRKNEYEFVLPISKTPIKFKFLSHGDEIAISKDVEAIEKITKTSGEITARYRRQIVEVNGIRDYGHISNFVTNLLLAGDSKALRKYANSITPDLNLTFKYTTASGEEEALRIPFGVDFFYPID